MSKVVRLEDIKEFIGSKEYEDWNPEISTSTGIDFSELKEELMEIFKADEAVSHSVVPRRRIRENLVCVYSEPTNELGSWFEDMCKECPYKEKVRLDVIEYITGEYPYDVSKDGDWWISDMRERAMKLPLCQKVEVYDEIGLVFAVRRCPKFNITFISDVTHTKKAFERFKRDFMEYIEMMRIERAIESIESDDTIEKMIEEGKFRVTLGTDVEMVIVDKETGRVYSAYEYGYTSTSSRIGCDGRSRILEMRAGVCEHEIDMVLDIYSLMSRLAIEVEPEYTVMAWHDTEPLGGHVHVAAELDDGNSINLKLKRPYGLVKLLNFYLGKVFDAVNAEAWTARLDHGYGSLGDWRYSGHHGVEYRTPPSAWILSPELTRITFKILRLVMEMYVKNNGKNVVVGDYPTVDDYLRLGLDRWEAEMFLNMKEIVKELKDEDVRECWGFEISPRPKVLVVFRDTWDVAVEERIRVGIEEMISEMEANGKINVVLFGLAKERGNKYYIPERLNGFTEKIERMGWEREFDEDLERRFAGMADIVIGVPYGFRKTMSDDVEKFLEIIKEIIKEVLQ